MNIMHSITCIGYQLHVYTHYYYIYIRIVITMYVLTLENIESMIRGRIKEKKPPSRRLLMATV